jgi:flagellar hook assembly protein FlgD
VSGFTASSDFPTTPGAYDGSFNGLDDVFVAKLDDPAMSTRVASALGREPAGSWRSVPNPTTRVTTLRFAADRSGAVTACIYDSAGRLIRTLPETLVQSGAHELTWDGRDDTGALVRSGVYFYRASIGGQRHTGKLVVAR